MPHSLLRPRSTQLILEVTSLLAQTMSLKYCLWYPQLQKESRNTSWNLPCLYSKNTNSTRHCAEFHNATLLFALNCPYLVGFCGDPYYSGEESQWMTLVQNGDERDYTGLCVIGRSTYVIISLSNVSVASTVPPKVSTESHFEYSRNYSNFIVTAKHNCSF